MFRDFFRTKLKGFEIVACLTVNIIKKQLRNDLDRASTFKDVTIWEPRPETDFVLYNKVVIRRVSSANQYFHVEDKHGNELHPYKKGDPDGGEKSEVWKFSSRYPLVVWVEDHDTQEVFVIDVFYKKRQDGKIILCVERGVKSLKKNVDLVTLEILPEKPRSTNGNGNNRKKLNSNDPQAERAKRLALSKKKEGNGQEDTKDEAAPEPRKKEKLSRTQIEAWNTEGRCPQLVTHVNLSGIPLPAKVS